MSGWKRELRGAVGCQGGAGGQRRVMGCSPLPKRLGDADETQLPDCGKRAALRNDTGS
jgi:hypothetical protein